MVFCRECKQRVEDCVHFVTPLNIPAVQVYDPKVRTLAYHAKDHILEITFKNGQVWQLFGVKPEIYDELLHATLSSFLNFSRIVTRRLRFGRHPCRRRINHVQPASDP